MKTLRHKFVESVPEKLEDGSILWSGIILDISKRKEAEAELNRTREMLEQTNHMARVGGWELDRINKVVTWSQVTKEIHEVPTDFMPDATMSIDFYKEGVNRDRFIKVTNLAIKEGIPFDERLEHILQEYGVVEKIKLTDAILRIQKR